MDDTNPSVTLTGQLTDVSQVEKFELSDEAYAQRQGMSSAWMYNVDPNPRSLDTVLQYKQRNKVGRFAPKEDAEKSAPLPHIDIPIGSRCEVDSTEETLHKRGTVRFVGPTNFANKEGMWVGVEFDEPMGKNDGSSVFTFPCFFSRWLTFGNSVHGERYFSCRPNYGIFVRPDRVKVGDYPVEELNLDDEEM